MDQRTALREQMPWSWIAAGVGLAGLGYAVTRLMKRRLDYPYYVGVTITPSRITVTPARSEALRDYAIVWSVRNWHNDAKDVVIGPFEPRDGAPAVHPLVQGDPRGRVRGRGRTHIAGVVKGDLPGHDRELRYKYTVTVPGQPPYDPEIVIIRGGR